MSCLGHKSAVFVEGVNVRSHCNFGQLVLTLCTFLSKNFNSLCNFPIFFKFDFSCFVCNVLVYRDHTPHLGDISCLLYLNSHAILHQGHKSLVFGLSFGSNVTSTSFSLLDIINLVYHLVENIISAK